MTQRLVTAGFLVLAIASSVPVTAFGSDDPDAGTPPSPAEWHKAMIQTPPGRSGCFEVVHPNTAWQEVPCTPAADLGPIGLPPTVPAPTVVDSGTPAPGLSAVGTGTAAPGPLAGGGAGSVFLVSVAYPNDTLAFAQGYFPQVLGVTHISSFDGDNDNTYSLQLNTNKFSTAACNGTADPANCLGWQQFLYRSDTGTIFMEYWLVNYGNACDTSNGWSQWGDSCVKDSASSVFVGHQPISNLSTLEVTGTASSSQDTVYFYYLASGVWNIKSVSQASVLGLAQGWKFAEYNIVGVSVARTATFNPGSSIVVAMDAWAFPPGGGLGQSPADPTICVSGTSTTGESNSLNLYGPCCPYPAISGYFFFESNTDGTNRPMCLAAKPTTQASISSLQGGPHTLSLTWTNGDGEATAVFMAAATYTGAPTPVDGTVYFQDSDHSKQGWQNSTFGQGTQIGTSGWYCVYNGRPVGGHGWGGVQVDGLQAGMPYRVMAVTYNMTVPTPGGYGTGDPSYLTTTTTNNPRNWIHSAQASNAMATSYSSANGSAMTLDWQNGDGDATAVFMAQNGTGNPLTDGLVWDGYQYLSTMYQLPGSQSNIFGQGTQLPNNHSWYCVYNGAATSATVSGLQPGLAYRVAAVSYTGTWNHPTFLRNPSNGWIINPISFISPPIGTSGQLLPGFDYNSPGGGYVSHAVPALPPGGLIALALGLGVAGRSRLSRRSKRKRASRQT